MTAKDHDQASDAIAGETSVFRANFVDKPDTWSPVAGQGPPPGSAPLLVVTRGPDAGSRLVLDKAVT